MKIIGIIPARMASSRFPGKPLAKIHGIPMLGHVYHRSKMCETMDEVYVATCDKEIEEYIVNAGGRAVMTADTHKRASDRAAEALLKIEAEKNQKIDLVVMIQGDEPMLHPAMIDAAVKPFFEEPATKVVNLMALMQERTEQLDPNEVKVVTDQKGNALYFSRESIPSAKNTDGEVSVYKQVCIIPFRRDFLIEFNNLTPTPLEIVESIDMLRVLEHGMKVKMIETDYDTQSVDTPDELKKVEKLMMNDTLMEKYSIKL